MSIRVDSAVRRHSSITFGPQFMQNDSLGYPPRSEQQATRLEHNLSARRRSNFHDSNLPPRCRAAASGIGAGLTLGASDVPFGAEQLSRA